MASRLDVSSISNKISYDAIKISQHINIKTITGIICVLYKKTANSFFHISVLPLSTTLNLLAKVTMILKDFPSQSREFDQKRINYNADMRKAKGLYTSSITV